MQENKAEEEIVIERMKHLGEYERFVRNNKSRKFGATLFRKTILSLIKPLAWIDPWNQNEGGGRRAAR